MKINKINKKGEILDLTSEWITWIVYAIIFFVVISTIVIIVYIPISYEFKIDGLRHSLLRQHLIYDKNCLAYEDERVHPGVIDIYKFNKNNLENCFESKSHGVQLTLRTDSLNTIKLNEGLNKFEFCFDKKNFYCTNQTYYVLINQNGNNYPGVLNINILNQK